MGIGAILFSYSFSYLFSKQKTADNYFGLLTMVFGYLIVPLSVFKTETILDKTLILKYVYPFYQIGAKMLSSNESLSQISKLIGSQSK